MEWKTRKQQTLQLHARFLPEKTIEFSRGSVFRKALKVSAEEMARETRPWKKERGREQGWGEGGRYELYVIRFQQRHHGLDNPETTLPTCCPRYPPGSTLLECRFEGDQPVANVVQVPGCDNNQKTCFLLETQASRSGPSSRYDIFFFFFFNIFQKIIPHILSSYRSFYHFIILIIGEIFMEMEEN